MTATLFDDLPVEPVWPACRYGQCGGPIAAVCVSGLPLCAEHFAVVADGPFAPILRPRAWVGSREEEGR